MKYNPLAPALIALAASWAAAVNAAAPSAAILEEVLITAQKKKAAENLQDVPKSISVYSGEQVEAIFAVDLTDIGLTTPNASLSSIPTFPGVANFVIRGMGTVGQSIPSADPAVGVMIDGVPLGTIYGVLTDLFDLESIEVLRGPQGTLFGRNVTGGAVIMRTKRPTETFEGKFKAAVGSDGKRDAAAVFSGPLGDKWAAKIAVLSKDHDDYWKNLTLGGSQGASRTLLIRPALAYRANNFDGILIVERGNMAGDGLGAFTWWADGGAAGGGFEVDPYDERVTYQGDTGESDLDWTQASLEVNWNLWGGVLTGVYGYRDLRQDMAADIDGFPGARYHFANGSSLEQEQDSLEVRWAGGVTNAITLRTGGYYFSQDYTYAERRILLDAVDRRGVSSVEHETYSLFAQADFQLAEAFTLIVGGRFTTEKKKAGIGLIGDPNAIGDCATVSPPEVFNHPAFLRDCQPVLRDSENWSNFSPKLGLSWHLSDNAMAFASYTRGFRSGGYNVRFTDLSYAGPNPASTPGPYDEETVDALEVGIKSELWGGKARINTSIFVNHYDDLQRTALNESGGQEILNAASAMIRGGEIDAVVAVTDRFTLQASLGYTDAKYDEFQAAEQVTGKSASDLRFVMAPEFTYNLAAVYEMRISTNSSLSWRASYSYVDDTFSDDFNRAANEDYALIDASLTWATEDGLKVAVFGKNITDEVYYDFGTNFSTGSLAVQSFWLTPPRTYGLELTYEF